MIGRAMRDERSVRAARHARRLYARLSAAWMIAMAVFGLWLVLR